MSEAGELFPSIGKVADKADQLPDLDNEDQIEAPRADEDKLLDEIESLCMQCEEQGITRMLLTFIPYFREVIVMSFHCDHCGFKNTEIQSAGSIRPEGSVYTVRIRSRADLDRQLVRSSTCTILISEFELTLPPSHGQLTTIEGLLREIISDLNIDQPLRRIQDEISYAKIQHIIDQLRQVVPEESEDDEATGTATLSPEDPISPTLTLQLDDPAGHSFIEFLGSMSDPKWNLRTYHRTLQQNIDLGLVSTDEASEVAVTTPNQVPKEIVTSEDKTFGDENPNDEVFVFPGTCSSCGHPLETKMKKVVIPYFKDVLIMSTNCDRCGYRDNEVKSGSAISTQGKMIKLKVEDREDLSRDVLKSETAGLTIPEIDLVLQAGTLGGQFTTLEGLLDHIYEELSEKVFAGDASNVGGHNVFEAFLNNLKQIKGVERPFTMIMDDPLANSYVQNLYAPDPDPNMEIINYDRTWEQNEELGLNDMKVEGYEGPEQEEASERT